jgi:hypothetical protein
MRTEVTILMSDLGHRMAHRANRPRNGQAGAGAHNPCGRLALRVTSLSAPS